MKTNSLSVAKSHFSFFKTKVAFSLLGLLCLALLSPSLRSQDPANAPDPNYDQSANFDQNAPPPPDGQAPVDPNAPDPPSRVARISFLDGTVSFQPGGQGEWGSAAQNRPVTVGDKLWTDQSSRAELQIGAASIHMGSMTALSFLNLDGNVMQVRVPEGAVNFRVRELREGDVYEVDTPNLAFTVRQAGAFRVNVSENGDATTIVSIRGEGEVTTGGKTYTVHSGEQTEFEGADNPQIHESAAPGPDGLDRWAAERDLRDDNSVSAKYVSQDVPGASDLDDNGTWNEEPEYGNVWYPSQVAPGWAPYSYGAWNYVNPWGWTWVGYEPWGFAPYHYGRWAYIGSRWGWCPGPIYARPFYGPAFVGWLGGPRFGVGFGFGAGFGVGWFPLGYHEPWYPGYHASRIYVNNINIHNTVIHNTTVLNNRSYNNYAYARNTRAVTAASRNQFVGGQSINRGANHITEASLRGAQVMNRNSFTPTRASSFGANHMNARAIPSNSVQNRTVVGRTTPAAAASRQPFQRMNGNFTAARPNNGNFNAARPNSGNINAGRPNNNVVNRTAPQGGFNNNANAPRQTQQLQGRPQSTNDRAVNNRPPNSGRTWEAQGNSSDRGNAPQGFGSNNRYNNGAVNGGNNTTRVRTDRPPYAGSNGGNVASRGNNSVEANRGASYESRGGAYAGRGNETVGRSNDAPQRSYSSPRSSYPSSRSYSEPTRSNSAPTRSNSAPTRSNSAPTRSYSAPSAPSRSYSPPARTSAPAPRSSGGGGGGGSAPHGGGGGGGGGSHGGGSPHGGGGGHH